MSQGATIKGTDLDGRSVTLQRSHPEQLSLFATFWADADNGTGRFSNTIELWDAIPKFYSSPKKMASLRKAEAYLPILEREFHYRGSSKPYSVEIHPARIKTKTGAEIEYYPTQREELVEAALRKLAVDGISGVFLDENAGVQFTLQSLRRELKLRGHSISYPALIDSLKIAARSRIVLTSSDGNKLMESSFFPTMMISSREEWLRNPSDTRCYIQFSPLVTQSVNALSYRQFDYQTYMNYKTQLARWFHKRLYHNYIQASFQNTFNIKASTIIRDSGLVTADALRFQLRHIEKSLEELKAENVIWAYEKSIVFESDANGRKTSGRRAMIDAIFELNPSRDFVNNIVNANRRQEKIRLGVVK